MRAAAVCARVSSGLAAGRRRAGATRIAFPRAVCSTRFWCQQVRAAPFLCNCADAGLASHCHRAGCGKLTVQLPPKPSMQLQHVGVKVASSFLQELAPPADGSRIQRAGLSAGMCQADMLPLEDKLQSKEKLVMRQMSMQEWLAQRKPLSSGQDVRPCKAYGSVRAEGSIPRR
eukprot:366466-Chlamydomonas_euryale.AAC.24